MSSTNNQIHSKANSIQDWRKALESGQYPFPLNSFIEQQVRATPALPAVTYAESSLTYEQLNSRANQLARHLIGLGVKPGALVGICLDRSIEMVVGLFGIMKAGGAYVPLDPEYPQNRLDFMTVDSGIGILVTEEIYRNKLNFPSLRAICLDSDWTSISQHNEANPEVEIESNNLAYMIYTSGSTGKPKGVVLEHEAIVNRLVWMQVEYQLGPQDRVLQKTPMSFDVSVWEYFWPLITGAELVMAKAGGHKDPSYLVETIIKHKITTVHFVPSMLNLFLSAPCLNRVTSLRQVFCSGEALPFELVRGFYAASDAVLHNLYGPTEAAVDVTYWECPRYLDKNVVPIGKPIANIQIHILNADLEPVVQGESGELHIGGIGLARGYWNRPELTAEKFIANPFVDDAKSRLYKSGDLARVLPDGNIEYLGRIDFQVKIRGLRIELGEIEATLLKHPAIESTTVLASEEELGEKRLLAYIVFDKSEDFSIQELRAFLLNDIPEYMIPSAFIPLDEMPLTPNGKVDRKALPSGKLTRPELNQAYIAPKSKLEKTLCGIWEDLLNIDRVGINDNFFDLGGNSLLCMMSVMQAEDKEGVVIPVVKLFQYPTVYSLAMSCEQLDESSHTIDKIVEKIKAQRSESGRNIYTQGGVAIIGMSGRFPGCYDVNEFWKNLREGNETITFFSKDELGPGLDPGITGDPNYVFARGIIPDGDKFDAAFFGINPTEAKTIDPQQRVFLELSWGALENAGYAPSKYDGSIGVYAGIGNNYYYQLNVMQHTDIVNMVGPFPIMVGNEKDHIATRVANKLNLTGPAVSVHTACSTALTAIDNAFFSLLTRQCDMALAGGISLQTPQYSGQLHQDGGVFSSDGHCRPFDSEAEGTLFSDSAGIVVMKRLDDAVKDGDTIYAVLKSTAINNDGSEKISYLAPSISGQKEVIAMALARAGVSAESISYVEAHGTGTPIGDPIEIEALTQVYRRDTQAKQFCGIGSVKSNLGHPTIAAGVTGVMKVALALKNEKIPATLHYKKPNPKIDFEKSPFYVVSKLQDWPRSNTVRRAAVSAFGFGGTNGHVILEECPAERESGSSRPKQLIQLSAKSKEALDTMSENLAEYLEQNPSINIADLAYTLQNGRTDFNHRRYVVCGGAVDAATIIRKPNPALSGKRLLESKSPEIVFMFPGQGSQYVNMGLNLYKTEPLFKEVVDNCADNLLEPLGCDLRDLLYPAEGKQEQATELLKDTRYQQPAIFVIEYALAKLWNSWGVCPDLMVGHSVGEYVCACLAGVFSLKDALRLIAERARLMSEQPEGGMLSVRLSAADVEARMPEGLSLAASNGPSLSAVAGPNDIIEKFKQQLKSEEIPSTPLRVSRAFHSEMMEPAVEPLCKFVSKLDRSPPKIPFISTMTAKWVTESEITDPEYWGKQLRSPVRFAEAIQQIWEEPSRVLLEVGPRTVTTILARQQIRDTKQQVAIASLSDNADNEQEWTSMLAAIGSLWLSGVSVDLRAFWAGQTRTRVPLPTYPFARKRYWLDPVFNTFSQKVESATVKSDVSLGEVEQAENTQFAAVPKTANTIRQELIGVLEEISGVEFGDDLDESLTFAEMGLDSLFLTQIAFKLKSDFQVEVSFRQLTENYTSVALLSDYIEAQVPSSVPSVAGESLATSQSIANQHALTPSAFQKDIFELIEQDGDAASCAHNESITVSLSGTLDSEAMCDAINMLVERHDALQITFDPSGEMLHLRDNVQIEVLIKDVSTELNPEKSLRGILKQDFIKPFDLINGPLFRAIIIKVSDDCHKVVLTAHLTICDGWSLDVLVEELGHLYSSIKTKTPANLNSSDSFIEYLGKENLYMQSSVYSEVNNYWCNKLAVSPPPICYPINPGVSRRTYNGARADLQIAPNTVAALKDISGQQGCSLYTILLAGLGVLFHGLSGQRKLIIGMPTAGQAISNKNHLVGNCLNYIPLIVDVDAQYKFVDLISSLRGTLLEAIENGRYSFENYANEAATSNARVPFIQACLNMSPKMEGDKLQYHQLEAEYDVNPRYFESFELFINAVTTTDNTLEFQFQYNCDLFNAVQIAEWQILLKSILERMASNSKEIVGDSLLALGIKLSKPESGSFIQAIACDMEKPVKRKGNFPVYFGENNELYGMHHLPKNIRGDTGILFCYPIGQEYMKSHWAFRLLANAMLNKGLPVFKFDFFGSGDSLGVTDDWNIDRWANDLMIAAEQLKAESGVKNVSVIALRFGSIITAKAMELGMSIEKLVLWDPIVCGTEYLTAIRSMQQKALELEKGYFPFPTDEQLGVNPDEIMGYIYTESLQEEINKAKLLDFKFENCKSVVIACSSNRSEYRQLMDTLEPIHPDTLYHVIIESVNWYDFEQYQAGILPSGIINKIASLFGAPDYD